MRQLLAQDPAVGPILWRNLCHGQFGRQCGHDDKTTDYWQGDEAKFIRSYNNGKGEVFVDDVKFDDSTQAYLVQVSFLLRMAIRLLVPSHLESM